jgi:hypothetical protein
MAVDIYEELARLGGALAQAQAALAAADQRIERLEAFHAQPTTRLAPVSYFRPDKQLPDGSLMWDAVIAAQPALALINPGSGPGLVASTSYAALVPRAQAAGVPIFGYTHTRYGARPIAEVKADIDNHKLWYGVAGVFIDTTSNKPEHVAYYQEICDYAHARHMQVCLNPGTQCLEDHARMADFVMCSEGDVPTYRARVARPWEAQYASKLWHCVHSCAAAEMPSIVALAKERRAGLLYVTDDVLPNPYNHLATNFAALVAELAP